MIENSNLPILQSVFVNYAILQIVILTIVFLIWNKWIKPKRNLWTYLTLSFLGVYVLYSCNLITSILAIEDLSIGGPTFAFEMMSLIGGACLVVAIGILAAYTSSKT